MCQKTAREVILVIDYKYSSCHRIRVQLNYDIRSRWCKLVELGPHMVQVDPICPTGVDSV